MPKRIFRFPWRTRGDIERDFEDEVRFHLELRRAELERGGLSAEQARLKALEQFGDLEDARAYCGALALDQERAQRRTRTVEAFVQDVRYTLRQFRSNPMFALGAVAILSLGIALAVASFVYVRTYLLRPLPLPAPDRLVWVIPAPGRDSEIEPPQGLRDLDWGAVASLFESTVTWDLDGFTLTGSDRSEYVDGAWVSAGFTGAIGTRAAVGRLFGPDDYKENAQVALISHALWQRRYAGDPNVLGQSLQAFSTDRPDGAVSATIVGVLPADLWHFNRFTDVLLPLPPGTRMPYLALLRPGDRADVVAERLTSWVRAQLPNAAPGWRVTLASAQDEYVFTVRPTLRVALAACLLLLLIVCVNVAGLLLTRTVVRRHELAVRSAIGAGRGRILRQLFTESLVIAGSSALLGLGLAHLIVTATRPVIEQQLRTPIPGGITAAHIDLPTIAFTAAIALVAAVVFGLAPVFVGARVNAGDTLSAARWSTAHRKGSFLRAAFVAAQFATCLALLAGSLTLARAALSMRRVDLGFNAEGVLKAHLLLPQIRYPDDAQKVRVVGQIMSSAAQARGAQGVALAFPHPFRPWGTALVHGGSGAVGARAMLTVIAGDYFRVMQIPLQNGRAFDARDRTDGAPVAIVSATLASRLWPSGSALGRQIRIGSDPDAPARSVVGVVADVKKTLMRENPPDVYLPFAQDARGYMALVGRSQDDPLALAAELQQAIWRVDRDLPLSDVEPLSAVIAAESARHEFMGKLTAALAALALILALVGLYASISYDLKQRERELAIRMAVGAQARDAYQLVLGRGLRLTVTGIAAGALLGAVITRTLAAHVPAVRALGLPAQGLLVLLLLLLTLAAVCAPARRAARLDPASLLRG